MGVTGHLHALASLPPWKEAPDLTEQEAGRPQNQAIHFGEDIYPLTLPGTDPQFLCRPVRSPVTILKTLTHTVTNPFVPIIQEHKILNVHFSV